MKKTIQNTPIISLVLASILCGLIWRVELEYYGWAGLGWLSYFHYAIPLGFCVFLFWVNLLIEVSLKRRLLFNVLASFFGVFIYWSMYKSLIIVFSSLFPPGLIIYSIFVVVLLMPIGAYFILRIAKHKVSFKGLTLSVLGIIVSVPLACFILYAINHKGGYDEIHAIKSGVLGSLWILSIGLLVINSKKVSQSK